MRLFYRLRRNISRSSKQDQSDTSTKIFVVWKSFGWIFPASPYSEPHRMSCQVPREVMSRARCTSVERDRDEEENVAALGRASARLNRISTEAIHRSQQGYQRSHLFRSSAWTRPSRAALPQPLSPPSTRPTLKRWMALFLR